MLAQLKKSISNALARRQLPPAAKAEMRRDREGLPAEDPGIQPVIEACIGWMSRAQDESASHDGGVARDFSLIHGWGTSYPETTGYIIPTFLHYARLTNNDALRERARRMLDWFVAIQLDGGGFQGGRIDSVPVVPVTFNTGQILLGLAAGVADFGDAYRPAMRGAADWLRDSLDEDGCWRKHPTPFAKPGEKAYETHVSWGLFEAARVDPDRGYGEAGLRNVEWALSKQAANGWFASCCLDDPERPLTHTIGYVLRGVLEAYRFAEQPQLLAAARRTADSLLPCIGTDGYLPGRFNREWQPMVSWVCLTGSVQIAHCLFLLYRHTGETRYRDAGFELTRFVRRSIRVEGPADLRGAVRGSFPVDGAYGAFQYLNWAAKFCMDANLLEMEIRVADLDKVD